MVSSALHNEENNHVILFLTKDENSQTNRFIVLLIIFN